MAMRNDIEVNLLAGEQRVGIRFAIERKIPCEQGIKIAAARTREDVNILAGWPSAIRPRGR